MEDKEIIIGKKDVAACNYWKACDYYKQLKRLQQDHVNLGKAFEHLKSSYQENQEYFLKLKAENESLKTIIFKLESKQTSMGEQNKELIEDIFGLRKENERLQKLTCFNCGEETLSPSGAEIYDKILVYEQTLQEIKAIASKIIDSYIRPYDNYNQLKQIIDLITKTEEE